MNIKHENHKRHSHTARHAKHPKQILQTKHIYNKIKRTTIWFWGGGGGGILQFMTSQNIYFQTIAGDNIYFLPPPPIYCSSPNKKIKGTSFNHSQ